MGQSNRQRYHNVFDYYRAPKRGGDPDDTSPLENNATKALVNVLEHCDDSVATAFLEWLGSGHKEKVRFSPPEVREFLLLKNPDEQQIRCRSVRRILGIVPHGSKSRVYSAKRRPSVKKGSPPADAWLLGDAWAILVESKLHDGLDWNQIKDYQRKVIRIGEEPIVVSWKDIHDFCERELAKNVCQGDRFLVSQLRDCLGLWGLSGFRGLDDASYFRFFDKKWQGSATRDEKERIRKKLRVRLGDLAGGVYERERIQGLYPDYSYLEGINYRPGGRYDFASFYFLPEAVPLARDAPPSEFTRRFRRRSEKLAHQCIQMHCDGLSVWVRVHKQALRNLLPKVGGTSGQKKMARILGRVEREMPGECYLELYHYSTGSDGRIDHKVYWRFGLGDIGRDHTLLKGMREELDKALGEGMADQRGLTLSLVRELERRNVVRTAGPLLVRQIADTMAAFDPFVRLTNG